MNFDLSSFGDLPQETQIALLALFAISFIAFAAAFKLVGTLLRNLRSAVALALLTMACVFLFGWVLPPEVSTEIGMMVGSCIARPFYIARDWEMQNNAALSKVLIDLGSYAGINVAVLASTCAFLSRSKIALAWASILGVSIAAAFATLGILAQMAPAQFS